MPVRRLTAWLMGLCLADPLAAGHSWVAFPLVLSSPAPDASPAQHHVSTEPSRADGAWEMPAACAWPAPAPGWPAPATKASHGENHTALLAGAPTHPLCLSPGSHSPASVPWVGGLPVLIWPATRLALASLRP